LQGTLLTTESGQPISGYEWKKLPPVNIEIHYGKLLHNPQFVEKLADLISNNYPTLEGKIEGSPAGSVENFVRGLGWRYK
jgi:hypothetical protein